MDGDEFPAMPLFLIMACSSTSIMMHKMHTIIMRNCFLPDNSTVPFNRTANNPRLQAKLTKLARVKVTISAENKTRILFQ